MLTNCPAMRAARALLYRRCNGILSVHSSALPGFQEAAGLPFCLDPRGRPVFMLFGAMERPRDDADRASLTIVDACMHRGRLSLHGVAMQIEAQDDVAVARFRRYFPLPAASLQPPGTEYWVLNPLHARYVDAAGREHWMDPEQLLLPNPVHPDDERDFVRHMNACHTPAMRRYCQRADVAMPRGEEPEMAGMDALGFHLRLGRRLVRFDFMRAVTSVSEIREELLALGHRAPALLH